MEKDRSILFSKIVSLFSVFWQKHPSFYLSLSAFLALSMSYGFTVAYLLPAAFLFYPYKIRTSLRIGLYVVFIFFFFYGGKNEMPPDLSFGKGKFTISSLKENTSFFQQKFLIYKGTLESFQTSEKTYKEIPCSVMVKRNEKSLLDCHDYLVEGTLKKNTSGAYSLKLKHADPLHKSFSLAKFRFDLKSTIKNHLQAHLDPESSSLLKALLLGDVDNKHLTFFFQKLGLMHILAISGFHFTLLAAFYGFILKSIFPRKAAFILLIALVSLYAFIIGPSPSVMRAWMMISLYLLFQIVSRSHLSINAMGASLLILLLCYPSSICDLGLHLSFLCTFAILTLYPFCESLVKKIFSSRRPKKIGFIEKCRETISSFFYKNLSLTLAVSVLSFPIILFTFHKFPLLSFFYNLFIPSLTACSFFLLLLAMTVTPLSFLSQKLYLLTGSFTKAWLSILYNSPPFVDRYVYAPYFPFPLFVGILTVLTFFAILVYQNDRKERW